MARTSRWGGRAFASRRLAARQTPKRKAGGEKRLEKLAKQMEMDLVLTPSIRVPPKSRLDEDVFSSSDGASLVPSPPAPASLSASVPSNSSSSSSPLSLSFSFLSPHVSPSGSRSRSRSLSSSFSFSSLSPNIDVSSYCLFFKVNSTRLHQSIRQEMSRIDLHTLLTSSSSPTLPLVVLVTHADSSSSMDSNSLIQILGLRLVRKRKWKLIKCTGGDVAVGKEEGERWARRVEAERQAESEAAAAAAAGEHQSTSVSPPSPVSTIQIDGEPEKTSLRTRTRSRSRSISLSPSSFISSSPASVASASSTLPLLHWTRSAVTQMLQALS